jgi:hypothetical protein
MSRQRTLTHANTHPKRSGAADGCKSKQKSHRDTAARANNVAVRSDQRVSSQLFVARMHQPCQTTARAERFRERAERPAAKVVSFAQRQAKQRNQRSLRPPHLPAPDRQTRPHARAWPQKSRSVRQQRRTQQRPRHAGKNAACGRHQCRDCRAEETSAARTQHISRIISAW